MIDYQQIFSLVEEAVISRGSLNLPRDQIIEELDKFKLYEKRELTDADYYWILVYVVFYSGFRASIVTDKLPIIREHFPNYLTVSEYSLSDLDIILRDDRMIRNKLKVNACFKNAIEFRSLCEKHGSFERYINSFFPQQSSSDLERLRQDLQLRFNGLGPITSFHFMTDIGLPVIKPDRVIRRIFYRLGLIENEADIYGAQEVGSKFADETGHPIRYIDIVLVAHGQVQSLELGIDKGACLKNNPGCKVCPLISLCCYPERLHHEG